MISRRRILSRSRDELDVIEEEDVWYQKEKLFKDHIQEVLNKWEQIDDEIWAKIICMERNRRVAKAYARAPDIEINGSTDGFDGFKIGLNAFDNPMRDEKTAETKKRIGNGARITMDSQGNIVIRRMSKASIFINGTQAGDNSSISKEAIESRGHLDFDKPVKLFDMEKFRHNVLRELKRAYPDRRHLEAQCICCVSFVRDSTDPLQVPIWIMIINIVALDMLKSKFPPSYAVPVSKRQSAPNLMSIFDQPGNGHRGSKDELEDPYTALPGGASSSGSSGHNTKTREPRPPKLPPRDKRPRVPRVSTPQPDYEEETEYSGIGQQSVQNPQRKISQTSQIYDDPYYCGMKARVPNFNNRDMNRRERLERDAIYAYASSNHSSNYLSSLYATKDRSKQSIYQQLEKMRGDVRQRRHYETPSHIRGDRRSSREREHRERDRSIYAHAHIPVSHVPIDHHVSSSASTSPSSKIQEGADSHDYSKIYGVLPLRQNSTAQSSSSGGSSTAGNTFTREVYVGEWE